MARDQVTVMAALGFDRFQVVGHDRGARVAHRMALDHEDAVLRLALLDIVPTLTLFETVNQEVAEGYYHWFFLTQPDGLPEHLIGLDPEFYLRRPPAAWCRNDDAFPEQALAVYLPCFRTHALAHPKTAARL